MTQKTLPANIGLDKYAKLGFHWQGTVLASEFSRLIGEILQDTPLSLTVDFIRQDGILWLTYDVKGVLPVSCQRCLMPAQMDVSGHYQMAIIEHEDQVAQIQDQDYVFLSELGNPTHLPIKDLIEDELLLLNPFSFRHEDCELLTDSVGEIEQADDDNPFAVLASLKSKPS